MAFLNCVTVFIQRRGSTLVYFCHTCFNVWYKSPSFLSVYLGRRSIHLSTSTLVSIISPVHFSQKSYNLYMSHLMTKPTKWLGPAKTEISLCIHPVWSEASLCAQLVATCKDPSFLHADSEDWSDWADAQADLSLCWGHMPFVGFVMRRLSLVYRFFRSYTPILIGCWRPSPLTFAEEGITPFSVELFSRKQHYH